MGFSMGTLFISVVNSYNSVVYSRIMTPIFTEEQNQLRATACPEASGSYELPVHVSRVTSHELRVTCHPSRVTSYESRLNESLTFAPEKFQKDLRRINPSKLL